MTEENDSLIPAEWYAIAARDHGAAKALLKDRDEFLPVAGMLLQQAVESRYPLRVTTPIGRADLEQLFAEAEPLIARILSRASGAE